MDENAARAGYLLLALSCLLAETRGWVVLLSHNEEITRVANVGPARLTL